MNSVFVILLIFIPVFIIVALFLTFTLRSAIDVYKSRKRIVSLLYSSNLKTKYPIWFYSSYSIKKFIANSVLLHNNENKLGRLLFSIMETNHIVGSIRRFDVFKTKIKYKPEDLYQVRLLVVLKTPYVSEEMEKKFNNIKLEARSILRSSDRLVSINFDIVT